MTFRNLSLVLSLLFFLCSSVGAIGGGEPVPFCVGDYAGGDCTGLVDVGCTNSYILVEGYLQCYWIAEQGLCYASTECVVDETSSSSSSSSSLDSSSSSSSSRSLASSVTTTTSSVGAGGIVEYFIGELEEDGDIADGDDGDEEGDDGGDFACCCFGIPIVGGIILALWHTGGTMLGGSINFCDYSLTGLLLAFISLSLVSLVYLRYVRKIRIKPEKFILRLQFLIAVVCLWLAVARFLCLASLDYFVIIILALSGVLALKHKIKILDELHAGVIFGIAGILLIFLLQMV
jgi:hypothetical protein